MHYNIMEKKINLSGQELNYDETGNPSGRPVILMHGWGCELSTVRSIARILEPGMHVYNLDLPGHGKSPEPTSVWGVYEYADMVQEFAHSLNISDPILVGHSFGGRLAIVLGSRGFSSKMMLVDAAGIKPKRKLSYYIKVYSFKTAKRVLPLLLGKKRGRKALDAWRGKAGSADYRSSSPLMRMVMSKSINQDLTPLLPSIKASTLLMWGENDTATPMRDAKIMEKNIPDAGLVVFKDAGHYSFLDQPGQFRAVTQNFFKNELRPKP